MKSLVHTVSPNPILCVSGWNLIWITDCPHSILQLFICDLCVHKRSFVFTECALVSMLMLLPCYAYTKNNSNSNTVRNTDDLSSRLRWSIIFRLVRQRQKCRKLCGFIPCCRLHYLAFFFCRLRYVQNTKRCVYKLYIVFPAWLALRNNASLFLQLCSACFLQKRLIYLFYVAWGREKAMLNPIWPFRLKRIPEMRFE